MEYMNLKSRQVIRDTAQGGRAFVMGIEFLDQPAEKMV